ncbi:MAG: hypothetical protein N3C12_03170 [Candidatus Binatia bacterium]|nr:hypothetical protein [Candidatus Binatia bacterium]
MPAFWGVRPDERPVRREHLVQAQRTLPPEVWRRPHAPLVRAGITGCGEELLVLAWSVPMLAAEKAAGVRLLRRVGLGRGSRVANTLPGALVTPGSLLVGDVVEELGALDVPLGAIVSEQAAASAWELVRLVEPNALVLETATATQFWRARPHETCLPLDAVVWLHRQMPAAWPELPEEVTAKIQLHWFSVPEVQCFFAHSCGDHFHVDELLRATVVDPATLEAARSGSLLVEWIDEEQGPVSYLVPWQARALDRSCSDGKGLVLQWIEAPPLQDGQQR